MSLKQEINKILTDAEKIKQIRLDLEAELEEIMIGEVNRDNPETYTRGMEKWKKG